MAFSFIASTAATPGANGGSTGSINSSGADLLIVEVAFYTGSTTTLSVSDSKGNSWVPLMLHNSGSAGHRFYYCDRPSSVGSSHTATVTGSSTFPVITFSAYSGRGWFEWENGATTGGATSLATGARTPVKNGSLVLSGWCGFNGTSNPSVDSSLTQTTDQDPIGGTSVAGAAGYYIQPTAGSINPTWSWSGSDHAAVSLAVFRLAASDGDFLVSTAKSSVNTTSVTTDPIDTTGATLLLAAVSHFINEPTFTDSEGNTWNHLTSGTPGDIRSFLYYCANPTTDSAHTFSASHASPCFSSIHVSAWSSFDTYDGVTNDDVATSGAALASGTITPNGSNRLVVSCVTFGAVNQSASAENSALELLAPQANGAFGASSVVAYEIQTSATAREGDWAWYVSSGAATLVAAFYDASPPGGGGGNALFMICP